MFSFIRNEKPKFDWMYLGIFLIVVLIQGFVGLIVYATGGTTFVYPYFMFFPVIVGGFIFGPYIGLLFGLIGGLILGPAMPLLVENNIPQAAHNWLIRTGFLSTAGGLVGGLRNFLIDNFRKREEYLTIDPFTKLPNRNSFISLLEDELREKSSYSVMLVEIKNQDDIVAAFGFDFFSQLIQFLDPELRQVLKLDKPIFSIRLNLIGFGLYKNHDWYARQLIEFFKKPLIVQGIPIFCDVALGISDYPSDAATPMELVQKGLLALDEAKKKNKPFQILSSREARLLPVIQLVSQIDEAIRKGELDFDYQPILSSKDLSPNSIEALVRWTHHEYGLISPSEYIDYLESTNLVNELTYWSIELNTQRIKELAKYDIPLQMAINISPTNLMQEDFVRRVDGIIKNSQVDPSLITFEITERGLVTSYDEALLSLSQLHELGIKISIDDFGAGNTSIDCFSKTKIDTLKIDQTFTKNIIRDETNRKIVRGLINLSASVGIETIAEGVETLPIYQELKSLNVDYVQGYYFFKPMNLTKATAWLKTYKGNEKLQ